MKKFKQNFTDTNLYMHGILKESNNKIYMKSKFKKKDKTYFSNFHYADIKNGYYIEDFLVSKGDVAENAKNVYERDKEYYNLDGHCLIISKIQYVLNKYGLRHEDLSVSNVKIYNAKNGYKPVCFDVGGLNKLDSSTGRVVDSNF